MLSALLAFFVSFVVCLFIGPFLIKFLRKLKFGQTILEIGPKWHMSKQYTPTMGGFIFIISMAFALLIIGVKSFIEGDFRHIAVFLFALSFAFIGFLDDYKKVTKKQNLGLTSLQKIILQSVASVVFASVLRYFGYLKPDLFIPFLNITIHFSWVLFLPAAAFIIVGVVNAVNLTDGVDGLAAGVTFPVAVFFTMVYILLGSESLTVFSAALAGGMAGFLIFNFNPAKVFMGDTGSLFIGGAISGLAFACNLPLLLVFVGIIYLAEVLSDIIQVFYFKFSKGKRLFKMAPLHHHFEMSGWSEKKIVFVFSGITAIMCILSYFWVGSGYRL